jgi:hypothetical protein
MSGRSGFDSQQGRNVSFRYHIHTGSGASQSPIHGNQRLFFWGLNRPKREIDHSHLSSAEVKNTWSYTSPILHGVLLN